MLLAIYGSLANVPFVHTGVASALLVSTDRAMPEPQSVGRVTGRTPTLFFVYQQLIIRIPIRDVVGCDYC